MKCEEALQKITPYIENCLQPRELEAFIEHIKQCPSCYDELETYYIVSRAVQYLDDEKQDTYNIMELLKRDIRMKEQGLRRRRRMHWLVFFCLLTAAALLAGTVLSSLGIMEFPIVPEFISV